jgi:hypothetical protein
MLLLLVKYRLAKKINPLFLLLNGNYSWDVALQHGQCAATYKHFISPTVASKVYLHSEQTGADFLYAKGSGLEFCVEISVY